MPAVIRPGPGEPLRGDGWRRHDRTGAVSDVAGRSVQRPARILYEAHGDVRILSDAASGRAIPGDAVELLVVNRITEEDDRCGRRHLQSVRHRRRRGRRM